MPRTGRGRQVRTRADETLQAPRPGPRALRPFWVLLGVLALVLAVNHVVSALVAYYLPTFDKAEMSRTMWGMMLALALCYAALLAVPFVPGVEIGIALSAIALGAMVVGEVKPGLPIAAALVAFFAIFHGHAHGTELPHGASGLYYSIGFVIATGLLHAAGIAFGMIHERPNGPLILRAAGGLVLVGGLYFLWQAIG